MSKIEIEPKLKNDYLTGRRNRNKTTKKKKKNEDKEITELLYKLPQLNKSFDVHRKIGEGTFSSVYLGSLRAQAALPESERRWFAIKHLVPTAHPARVEHELRCLRDIGGKDHVIGVDLCLRNCDTIVFVMPYIPHMKFSEYMGSMDAEELRRYMRALLLALRRVHAHGVIHRDVKPSNFLYDRDNRRYMLVDFGLAQRVCPAAAAPRVLPALAPLSACPAVSTKRPRDELQEERAPQAKRPALGLGPPPLVDISCRPTMESMQRCVCAGVGGVCGVCAGRASARAARAGTAGFRPPEVLLKCERQGSGLDLWAGGVVLASVLLARYPLLRAADDLAALAELAALLGSGPLWGAASAMGRRLVWSSHRRGLSLRKLCALLRGGGGSGTGGGGATCADCGARTCVCRTEGEAWPGLWWGGFPDEAFSLAARLLDPLPHTRITAAQALKHPFITGDYTAHSTTAAPHH